MYADTHNEQNHELSIEEERISNLLKRAEQAYEENDSTVVSQCCEEIIVLDPDNYKANVLMAKFGGWDSRLYDFDLNVILRAIKHALSLTEHGKEYSVASDIYVERKRQLALRLDAALMMPSYQGSKTVHQIMMDWKKLLTDIPYLSPGLIQNELNLCSNLCLRSKMGIMPGDRLVYSAYATFNKKVPYGDTFREALSQRIEREKELQEQRITSSLQKVEELIGTNQLRVACGEYSPKEEKTALEESLDELYTQLSDLEKGSEKTLYESQLQELRQQLDTMKPYKIFKRQTINTQIQSLEKKLSELDSGNELMAQPLKTQISKLEARLSDLKKEAAGE